MAVTVIAFLALVGGVGYVVHHGSGTRTAQTFGGFPSFLPPDTLNVGVQHAVVDATIAKPALATQGDTVRVHLPSGTVLITGTGPEVPNEGLPYQRSDSPTQWTVTMTGVSGTVPVKPGDFDSIDDDGKTYHPTLIAGATAPPATLAAGQTVTFKVHTVMKTGEGLLRWLADGKHSPVEWDFVVEDD